MVIKERAFAKVNLQLNILGRRPDGYHEVDMLMQTLDFCDEVLLEEGSGPGIFVKTNVAELNNGDNLACRAAGLLAEYAKVEPRLKITIRKNIFQAAGLGGGSADAAAVFRGLNKLWGLNYSYDRLERIAGELGSDIPFLIQGGTARATGRGEVLEHLDDEENRYVVLAKPREFGISTRWAYEEFDKLPFKPDGTVGNVFETVVFPRYPLLAEMKRVAMELGAERALMSGSGPTMYALTADGQVAATVESAWGKYPVETVVARFAGRIRDGS